MKLSNDFTAAVHSLEQYGYELKPTQTPYIFEVYELGKKIGRVDVARRVFVLRYGKKEYSYWNRPFSEVVHQALSNASAKSFNLNYYIGSRLYEVVCKNQAYAYCKALAQKKAASSHKIGILKIEPAL